MVYQDAYEVANEYVPGARLRAQDFLELLNRFRSSYLKSICYNERIASNRSPDSVRNEMLNGLREYLSAMQNRPELKDHSDPGVSSYVCTKLTDMWRADDSLCSLYDTILLYCQTCNRDLKTTMIHVAEYRSLNKLFHKERRRSQQ